MNLLTYHAMVSLPTAALRWSSWSLEKASNEQGREKESSMWLTGMDGNFSRTFVVYSVWK